MKLLELCLSSAFGGLEIHVRDFIVWISDTRPDVELHVAVKRGSRLDDRLSGFEACSFKRFRKHAGVLPLMKAKGLARYIEENEIDVVHVHDKYDLPLAAFAKARSRRRFALVHTRQMNMPGAKKGMYHRFIYGKLDRFIAMTKFLQQQAIANLPMEENRIRQVYLGCEAPRVLSPDQIAERRRSAGIPEGFTVGLVGRIKEYKGQHLLVEAIEKLAAEGTNVSAFVVGQSMEDDYLENLKKRVEEKSLSVSFHGFMDNIPELMQCFDVVALTTRNETFGYVLVEAMLAGVPVIGSNAGGVPEIIDHNETGLLFEPDAADSLKEQIATLHRDGELRARLAQAGKKKAMAMFLKKPSFERCMTELEEAIKAV